MNANRNPQAIGRRTAAGRFPRNLWRAPLPALRPAATALELPVRPSPRLRVARRLFLAMILMFAVELVLGGHWLAAPLILACAAGGLSGPASGRARTLRLAPDGRLFIEVSPGGIEEVSLRPESLRCGSHLLLVLRGAQATHRLLLGPDNVAADHLADLWRRLPPEGVPPTGVHSVAAPGSNSSDRP